MAVRVKSQSEELRGRDQNPHCLSAPSLQLLESGTFWKRWSPLDCLMHLLWEAERMEMLPFNHRVERVDR